MPGKHSAPEKPKKRGKAKKAVAITLVCAILLGGAGVGGYYVLHNRTGKDVNVYPVNMLGTMDNWYDRVNTGGQVRADKMQAVYLSSTQTVTEVYVQEGQQVKVGDPILAFDTTLDEVELTRKQIAIDQLNLDLKDAQAELAEINTYRVGTPGYGGPAKTPAPTAEPEPTTVPWFQGGTGTAEDPYVFLWDENASLLDGTVDYLLDMAMGYGVPEVTTGPDVPLDPDQTPPDGQTPDGVELAEAVRPGALKPVGVGQSWTVGGLVAMSRPDGQPQAMLLAADGGLSESPAPTDTEEPEATESPAPTDTEAPEATETPAPADTAQPEATETPDPDATAQPEASAEPSKQPATYQADQPARQGADEPALPSSFEDAVLDWFQSMAGADELADYYGGMTKEQKQLIANILNEEQMEKLLQLLTAAGVAEPSFPPRDPQSSPEPDPTAEPSPDPSASPEPTLLPVGATYYMVFEVRANNSMQGDILWTFEIQFTLQELEWQRCWGFRVLEPMYEPQIVEQPEEGDHVSFGSGNLYPASEIEKMRNDAEQKIRDLTLQLKMAEQELKAVEYELSNGEVLCTTDGVVKSVLDPTEALESEQPVVMVSGGGGYFVDVYMSEFDMQHLHVGDTVTVENYMAGEEVDGVITEISQFPYSGSGYVDYSSSGGNNNASKYPFTVAIDESADLREYYYVNVYFSASGTDETEPSGSFYMENAFIRTENGRSYVYVAGENGLLEKRYVTTGKSMGGYYTEITSGLDYETDYVAFPYGRDVKNGAKAVFQEDISVLYNGY